jgi:hypothetical protein
VGRKRNGWFQPGLGKEALRKRRQTAIGQVQFDSLNAVHGKENDGWSERLSVPDHDSEILKGCEFGAAETEALGCEGKDHPPELLARIAQGRNDECAGCKKFTRPGRRGLTNARRVALHTKIVAGRRSHCKSTRPRGVTSINLSAVLDVISCGYQGGWIDGEDAKMVEAQNATRLMLFSLQTTKIKLDADHSETASRIAALYVPPLSDKTLKIWSQTSRAVKRASKKLWTS